MKTYITDKTNWKKMLSSNELKLNLIKEKHFLIDKTIKVISKMNETLNSKVRILRFQKPINIRYPVKEMPHNLKLFPLENINNEISDYLIGIKGQYLLFKNHILSMRKIQGYELTITIS